MYLPTSTGTGTPSRGKQPPQTRWMTRVGDPEPCLPMQRHSLSQCRVLLACPLLAWFGLEYLQLTYVKLSGVAIAHVINLAFWMTLCGSTTVPPTNRLGGVQFTISLMRTVPSHCSTSEDLQYEWKAARMPSDRARSCRPR